MFVQKTRPGRYTVWIGDIWFAFRTERDAERFVNAARYAFEDSRFEPLASQERGREP